MPVAAIAPIHTANPLMSYATIVCNYHVAIMRGHAVQGLNHVLFKQMSRVSQSSTVRLLTTGISSMHHLK